MSIVCASYTLYNGNISSVVQSFTDCSGNTCSVTIQPDEVYFITADLYTFVADPKLTINQYDIRYVFTFSSCCGNDQFHILGSGDAGFTFQNTDIGLSYYIDEFTNPLTCDSTSTPSIGCYTLIDISINSDSSATTPQMYGQGPRQKGDSCSKCIEKNTKGCCNCYEITLPDKCDFQYRDCEKGDTIITLYPGVNYLCSTSEPSSVMECLYTVNNLGFCSNNPLCKTCTKEYCLSNTGQPFDDTYGNDGTYDGYDYYISTSGNYYIYYDTGNLQWCLSTSLGGICILTGKSPCFSKCPDLCDEYFSEGICPTTTTTTLACETFNFDAIFDCLVEPTPTPSITPSLTPTNTPTPSSTSYCSIIGVDATINSYSPTPTPTPTQTPTPTPIIDRPCAVNGDVSFTTVEGNIICSISKQFQDCVNGMMYYTTELVPTPSGDTLEQYMIFKAYVNGELKCISYVGTNDSIIGADMIDLVEGPVGYSNLGDCVSCIVVPSPTPTPTLTMTPTPSGIPCYCYQLISGEKATYTYTDCNGISQTGVTSGSIPLFVCSLTYPIGHSKFNYSINKLDICSNGECSKLICKCYSVSNGGPTGNTTSSSVSVVYYDCDNRKQILTVNDYSSSNKFCSLTVPFIVTTGHATTINTFGNCINGSCPVIL